MNLININTNELFAYLKKQSKPVMEIELLKKFITKYKSGQSYKKLFHQHFSLYHSLYLLKNLAGKKNYYIHLDPMRIRLLKIPAGKTCHYYNTKEGFFCSNSATRYYCMEHETIHGKITNLPSYDLFFDFYNNEKNIEFGNSDLFQKLMNGIQVYAFKKGEIESALKLFNLPQNPQKKAVKKRYRELVSKYHPDMNKNTEDMMKKVNSAYSILKEIFVL